MITGKQFMAPQGTSMVRQTILLPSISMPRLLLPLPRTKYWHGGRIQRHRPGRTYTHLSIGERVVDTDNARFSLGSNGILTANQTFNYSTDSLSYSIRVQVKDELNATAENSFTIQLLDDPSDNPIELTMSSTRELSARLTNCWLA